MSTDRKIKGHAGSYGVAKYGLLVFRIPGAAGGPANWFGWLGGWCRRADCHPAKTASWGRDGAGWRAPAPGLYWRSSICTDDRRRLGTDTYLLLVRWKGSSLSIERSTGPFSQIFSLCSKFGHSCSNPYNPKHNKKP